MGKYFKKSELVFAEKSKNGNFKNLDGEKHGRLTVIGFAGKEGGNYKWYCECECGNIVKVRSGHFKSGEIVSCGCYEIESRFKHGDTINGCRSDEYIVWVALKGRCMNPNNPNYNGYGGRGIKVCDRWKDSYKNFLEDMGRKPKGTSIDRIDNDGNYEPGNCRWAIKMVQNNNRRNNVFLTYLSETMTLAQWSERLDIDFKVLHSRIFRLKWPVHKAFSTPVRKMKK